MPVQSTKIQKIVAEGKGLCHVSGKAGFIPFTIPDELIEIRPLKEKKKFFEGEIVSILEPSNQRISAKCPVFTQCGGCSFQHLEYSKQLDIKKEVFQEQFQKIAKISLDHEVPVYGSPDHFHYRNKVEFQLRVHQEKLETGFFHWFDNRKFVPIDSCYLVNQNLLEIRSSVLSLLNQEFPKEIVSNFNRLTLSTYSKGFVFIQILQKRIQRSINFDFFFQQLSEQFPDLKFIFRVFGENKGKRKLVYQNQLQKEKYLPISFGDFEYLVPVGNFVQVNTPQFQQILGRMKQWVQELTHSSCLVDLYCGAGVISLFLARFFQKVVGLDITEDSIQCANWQTELKQLDHVKFYPQDLTKQCQLPEKLDLTKGLLIVDPPRSGLSEAVLSFIQENKPKTLFYLSCNSGTFSRDLQFLQDSYKLQDVTLWDMFPQTHHVEVLAKLEKRI
ncbi:MAG: 23S rRNA (uracil1939-C5)-methyltransferase [bacterium]